MTVFRPRLSLLFLVWPSFAATFGTPTFGPRSARLGDIVLDEIHFKIYAPVPAANTLAVYSYTLNGKVVQPTLASAGAGISTHNLPISVAMSPDGSRLYVACYNDSVIDVFDLTKSVPVVINSITLGSNPEAVAVGYDGRVLISTIGGNGHSILAIYDPSASTSNNLEGIVTGSLTAPLAISEPLPADVYMAGHARFAATPDGKTIAGVHTGTTTRTVFVYDVASATVLAARTFSGFSATIAISPDGAKILSGNLLLDGHTLAVLGTQNINNAPYIITGSFTQAFPSTTTTNITQGGGVFSPVGNKLYAAYNIVPLQNPAAKSNLSQLTVNTPDSLLVTMGIQLPENLDGKMIVNAAGDNLYGLSQSGFTWLPIGVLPTNFAIGVPASNVALLASDQCGVTASMNSATIQVKNAGGGNMTLSTPLSETSSSTSTQLSASGSNIIARFNSAAAKNLGTASPDVLLLQSPQAVNILNAVRVYQNNRNAEAPGTIFPVDIGAIGGVSIATVGPVAAASNQTGLTDIVFDSPRHRLYISNYALNRIEIFDAQNQQFVSTISVGQQPKALALSTDGNTLYVANGGSEFVSIVDLNKAAVVGQAFLPPVVLNSASAPIYPSAIAASQRGVQVLTSNGAIYNIVGNNLVNRTMNPAIFGTAATVNATNAQMIATTDGSQILLLAGNGIAYIYDSSVDDYIAQRQIVTVTGGFGGGGVPGSYFGPLGAGPNGSYFLVDDQVLNSSLSLIAGGSTTGVVGIGGLPTPAGPSSTRPMAAVAAVNANTYIRFSTPIRASANTAPTDGGLVELVQVDQTAQTVRTLLSVNTLEGPLSQVSGTSRVLVNGRTMAYDAAGGMVYILTASGLSAIPLNASAPPATPQISAGGVVNTANYQRGLAPTGLVSLFGRNLASNGTAGSVPLASILGGTCVTLNNAPLPLLATTTGQINAQIPTNLAAGSYPLVVRSIANQVASTSTTVTVAKYAPAIFMDANGPAIFHKDGTRVDKSHPAVRDEELTLYATGLGTTTGGKVVSGNLSPSSPLAVTAPLQLFFGNPTISDSAVIVDWSGLMPGSIGVYQINGRVPGTHLSGNALPVTLRIGNVSSPTTGQNVAVVYVN